MRLVVVEQSQAVPTHAATTTSLATGDKPSSSARVEISWGPSRAMSASATNRVNVGSYSSIEESIIMSRKSLPIEPDASGALRRISQYVIGTVAPHGCPALKPTYQP